MIHKNPAKSFTTLRGKIFVFRREREIHQIFDQLNRRRNAGFPFSTEEQMNQQTAARDLRLLLDLIDEQSPEMGRAYSEAFRYLLHRDIYARLELYLRHIQSHVPVNSRVRAFTS